MIGEERGLVTSCACQYHHITDSLPWQWWFITIAAVDFRLPFSSPVRTSLTTPPVRCSTSWLKLLPYMSVSQLRGIQLLRCQLITSSISASGVQSSFLSTPLFIFLAVGVVASSYSNYFCDSTASLITTVSNIVHRLLSDTWSRIFNNKFSLLK